MHAEETILHDSAFAEKTHSLPPDEIVSTAACFDPTSVDPAKVYRLALEIIAFGHCDGPQMIDMAKMAMREVDAREAA